jgi:hypothetical protein
MIANMTLVSSAVKLSELFWSEDVWLPPNVTWAHLKSREDAEYYEFADLLLPIPAAFIIVLCRRMFER